ncbi:MAG: hypothetical protein K5Q68_05515, partial [Roseococcus sp.]|nr:hypothetical protein [Roseococcus sp.]
AAPPPVARSIPPGPPPLTRTGMPTAPSRGAVAPSPPTATQPAPTIQADGFALSPAQLAGATTALAFIVGPIARILVSKAAAQAGSRAEFLELLCAHASGAELAALRPKLDALF